MDFFGWTAYIREGIAYYSKKVLEEDLPQGLALSSTLFLIFLNDLPQKIKSDKGQTTDDLSLWQTQNEVGTYVQSSFIKIGKE